MAIERIPRKSPLKRLGLLGVGIIFVYLLFVGYAYLASPVAIRNPSFQHYHLRLQILVNGKTENFGDKKYQVATPKDVCNVALAKEPLHFHDNKDQMLHVHWDGLTGGGILKYYGWNYVGGIDNALGFRFDQLPKIEKVMVHGRDLPAVPKDMKFYVFVGDTDGYKERNFNTFLHQDLEDFLGKQSNIPESSNAGVNLWNTLFPKAYAHDGHEHTCENEEELKRLNNLIGNIVIFAQKDKPSADQIKARFKNLEPLGTSTCAG